MLNQIQQMQMRFRIVKAMKEKWKGSRILIMRFQRFEKKSKRTGIKYPKFRKIYSLL